MPAMGGIMAGGTEETLAKPGITGTQEPGLWP